MQAPPRGFIRPAVQRLYLGLGGVAVLAAGGLVAWRLSAPAKLGLERPRVVVASGDFEADGKHARPKQVLGTGTTLRTGHGSACVSIHASRLCLGANAEVHLGDIGPSSAAVDVSHGTVIAASSGDDLRLTFPAGTVTVRDGTAAVEGSDSPDPTLRALEGVASLESPGKPSVSVAAPDAVAMRDGRKRPPAAPAVDEERKIAQLARGWQGSAGVVVDVQTLRGRVEIDGADLGFAPVSALLAEGEHTLVVRDGVRESLRETLRMKAGEQVLR